jgi:hypothetical protein
MKKKRRRWRWITYEGRFDSELARNIRANTKKTSKVGSVRRAKFACNIQLWVDAASQLGSVQQAKLARCGDPTWFDAASQLGSMQRARLARFWFSGSKFSGSNFSILARIAVNRERPRPLAPPLLPI